MSKNALRVGVGGPVGCGKTALIEMLCKAMRDKWNIGVVTNDIYTKEDQRILTEAGALDAERIIGVETGGCPHTAIREDASMNLADIDELNHRIYTPLPTMVDRLKLGKCELCGSSSDLVMYQVRNLRLLKPDTNWHKLMIEKNRKTLAVCENCYRTIHSYGK